MARIGFVLPGFPRVPGGGHKVAYQYANGLAESGHDVTVFHLRPRRPGRRRVHTELAARIYYASMRTARPAWFTLDPRISTVNGARQKLDLVARQDALIATGVLTADFVHASCQQTSARGLYLIQHYEDFSADRDFVDRTWRLPLEKVVISSWLRTVADQLQVDVHLIRNAIDPLEFPKGPELAGRPIDILGLASEQTWKRTDLQVAVARHVRKSSPGTRVHLFGVNPRPDDLPRWIKYTQNPSPDELSALYRSAKIYLCTSDFEGFGLPAAEAMASGTAVVSTRNGGVEDFAGGAAQFCSRGNLQELADAVLGLLNNPRDCQRLADRGYEAMTGRTITDSQAEFDRVLSNVLSRQR